MKIIVDKVFILNIMAVMNIQHGNKKEVAKWLGTSPSHLCNILTGRRKPGRSLAVTMQNLVGIKVSTWEDADGGKLADSLASKIYKSWILAEGKSAHGKSRHRKSRA